MSTTGAALTPKLSQQRHDFSNGVGATTATTSVVITPVSGCPWAFLWLDLWWLDLRFDLSSNRLGLACSQGALGLSAAVADRSMEPPIVVGEPETRSIASLVFGLIK
jgi:hypothetical protein